MITARRTSVLLSVVLLTIGAAPADAGDGSWRWPLGDRRVVERFDPPVDEYAAGHRGIDLAGRPGESVRAVAAGQVAFAGPVAGVGVVTIDHGSERSTYQPVDVLVRRGDEVGSGDVIGRLTARGSHCAVACLHLGRLDGHGAAYLDPLGRLASASGVRLVDPEGPPPTPPVGPTGDGSLRRPVGGPVTSPFGHRVHPVTGVPKLHDGLDFGVPCGTPVSAAGAGTVVGSAFDRAYGNRVIIRHGSGLRTSYNHLASHAVRVGQRVTTSTVVGEVGSTGLSTGCHLHFMVERRGKVIDPQGVL